MYQITNKKTNELNLLYKRTWRTVLRLAGCHLSAVSCVLSVAGCQLSGRAVREADGAPVRRRRGRPPRRRASRRAQRLVGRQLLAFRRAHAGTCIHCAAFRTYHVRLEKTLWKQKEINNN